MFLHYFQSISRLLTRCLILLFLSTPNLAQDSDSTTEMFARDLLQKGGIVYADVNTGNSRITIPVLAYEGFLVAFGDCIVGKLDSTSSGRDRSLLSVVERELTSSEVEKLSSKRKTLVSRLEENLPQFNSSIHSKLLSQNALLSVEINNDIWDCPIPYVNNLPGDRHRVENAVTMWEAMTPWRFVERTTERDYVEFVEDARLGCASWIGKQNGRQEIWMSPECTVGNAMHEIGHAIGLFHEHTRSDREDFINVHFDNILEGAEIFFEKISQREGNSLGDYDFDSIMHYSLFAFTKQTGAITIEPLVPMPVGVIIGQRDHLSEGDAFGASDRFNRAAIKCPETPSPANSPSEESSEESSEKSECECSGFSCSQLGLDPSLEGGGHVCAESNGILGECSGRADFLQALSFCSRAKMRLCTLGELEADEAAESGCSYDTQRIWSSTPCIGGYMTAAGEASSVSLIPTQCFSMDSRAVRARCCADIDLETCCGGIPPATTLTVQPSAPPSKPPTAVPSSRPSAPPSSTPTAAPTVAIPPPTPPSPPSPPSPKSVTTIISPDTGSNQPAGCVCSQASCAALGLNPDWFGGSFTCAASQINGMCSGRISYEQAYLFCAVGGMRMCTIDELIYDEARDSGCSYDDERLWSSTQCDDDSFYTAAGQAEYDDDVPTDCTPRSEHTRTRCCADADLDDCCRDPGDLPAFPPECDCSPKSCHDLGLDPGMYGSVSVCASSGSCSSQVPFDISQEFCSDLGMRLCTIGELENDEARDTGCNYDDRRLWSSSPCELETDERLKRLGYWTSAGEAQFAEYVPTECTSPTANGVRARCCADENLGSCCRLEPLPGNRIRTLRVR